MDPSFNKRYNVDEVLNMHIALIETLMPGINPERGNQCKQFQYCLCWGVSAVAMTTPAADTRREFDFLTGFTRYSGERSAIN
jgi:hypothetical protein